VNLRKDHYRIVKRVVAGLQTGTCARSVYTSTHTCAPSVVLWSGGPCLPAVVLRLYTHSVIKSYGMYAASNAIQYNFQQRISWLSHR
jgi:hypothetical protein